MIGVDALAAVTVFFPVMFAFIALVMGLSSGASVLIGQAFGAGDRHRVKAVAGTTLGIALLFATAIALFGSLFARELLIALATPQNVLEDAISYARISMIFMPLTFVIILMTSMLRGVGDTVTPLLALVILTLCGLVITPIMIQGWLGLPRLGVASAAWAAMASGLVTLGWLVFYLRRRQSPLAFDNAFLRAMWPDGKLLRIVLRLGIPASLGMIVMSVAELVLLGLVNGFGSDATAAYGAVNQVHELCAVSRAFDRNHGLDLRRAGDRSRRAAARSAPSSRTGLQMNLVLTGGLALLGYLFSRTLMGLFITDSRGARSRAGAAAHRAVEHGAVRHGDGIFRRDARGRHGLGAAADLVVRDSCGRGAVRHRPQPAASASTASGWPTLSRSAPCSCCR